MPFGYPGPPSPPPPRPQPPPPPCSPASLRKARRLYLAELLGMRRDVLDAMVENRVFTWDDSDEVIIGKVKRLKSA